MKRMVCLFLAVVMILSVTGCGKKTEPQQELPEYNEEQQHIDPTKPVEIEIKDPQPKKAEIPGFVADFYNYLVKYADNDKVCFSVINTPYLEEKPRNYFNYKIDIADSADFGNEIQFHVDGEETERSFSMMFNIYDDERILYDLITAVLKYSNPTISDEMLKEKRVALTEAAVEPVPSQYVKSGDYVLFTMPTSTTDNVHDDYRILYVRHQDEIDQPLKNIVEYREMDYDEALEETSVGEKVYFDLTVLEVCFDDDLHAYGKTAYLYCRDENWYKAYVSYDPRLFSTEFETDKTYRFYGILEKPNGDRPVIEMEWCTEKGTEE